MSTRDESADRNPADRLREMLSHAASEVRISSEQLAFRQAAALLSKFDPTRLRPVGGLGRDKGALFYLFKDSTVLGEPGKSLWALKPEIRRQTLASMRGADDVRKSLEANPDAEAPGWIEKIRAFLSGSTVSLDRQSTEELTQTLQVVRWLSLVPGLRDIPAEGEVLAEIERKALLDPFRRLVARGFFGRESELDQLRSFVGVLAPTLLRTKIQALNSRFLRWFHARDEAPLLIHGPGGIGKSTLIAQFIVEHLEVPARYRFPFAYLDFERPSITALEPMTLVSEAIRQLKLQYPDLREDLTRLLDRSRGEAARQTADERYLLELRELDGSPKEAREKARWVRSNRLRRERHLFKELAKLLGRASGGDPAPFLLVLDSFERTQYKSYLHLSRIWRLFDALHSEYPMLRVVVSGRAPVKGLKIKRREPQALPIREFGEAAATEFLVRRSSLNPRIARKLVGEYGGNPLTLNLLARLGEERPLEDKKPKKSWSDFLGRNHDHGDRELVQALLYERLLGQIRNKEILPLANPGLVLRRITPEIIQEVLAPYCKLDVPTRVRAEQLFLELERHVDLVDRIEPDVLGHVPEVREMMLKLLEKDDPSMVAAIENAAVRYYERKPGPQARAEEIYHRLRLKQPLTVIESRWEPGVDRYLREDDLKEIPEAARAFLASKLGSIAVNEVVEAAEDQSYREASVARQAADLIADGHFEEALELIQEPDFEWSAESPLNMLTAEALMGLSRLDEAAALVGRTLDSLYEALKGLPAPREIRGNLLALHRIAARLAISKEDWENVDRHLARSYELASGLDSESVRLQILFAWAQTRTQAGRFDDQESMHIRAALAREFLRSPNEELAMHPSLVAAIGSTLGFADASVLKKAVEVIDWVVGLRNSERLEAALSSLSSSFESWRRWLKEFSKVHGFMLEGNDPDEIKRLLGELRHSGKLSTFLSALVDRSEERSDLRLTLALLVAWSSPLQGSSDPA